MTMKYHITAAYAMADRFHEAKHPQLSNRA